MSAYSGRQGRGASKARKTVKREQANKRNAATLPERRKAFRKAQKAA